MNTPVLSDNLKENVDELSYEIFKDKDEDELRDLIEVAEVLEIDILKEVVIACLGCQFFIADKEEYIKKFIEKNQIEWELSEEEKNEIIAQNEAVFYELYNV